jgi:hypothetical protein
MAVEKMRISIMPIPVATIGVPVHLLTRSNTGWRFACCARPTRVIIIIVRAMMLFSVATTALALRRFVSFQWEA